MQIERRKNHGSVRNIRKSSVCTVPEECSRLTGATSNRVSLPPMMMSGIERIRNDVAIFLRLNRSPVAKRNCAVVAAAFNTDRTASCLTAVKPIRKRVVGADMIQLRGG